MAAGKATLRRWRPLALQALLPLLLSLHVPHASGANCQPEYDGFPGLQCNPASTTCSIRCTGPTSITRLAVCDDIEQTFDCAEDICATCSCLDSGGSSVPGSASQDVTEIFCGDELSSFPRGMPLGATRFQWTVERSDNIRLGQLMQHHFRPDNSIRILRLAGLDIDAVDASFFTHLTRLRTLEIASANLGAFPWQVLASTTRLLHLQLTSNALTTFDASVILQRPGLRQLQISDNHISQFVRLPEGSEHAALDEITLRGNPLPDPVNLTRGMTGLRQLITGATRFTHIPRSIADPRAVPLQTIELTGSALVHIPFALATDLMEHPSAPMGIAMVIAGSPSECSSVLRSGTNAQPYLEWVCTCEFHYSRTTIIKQANMTHCPLPRMLPCPLGNEPLPLLRLDQYCDGFDDCDQGVDEICDQVTTLRVQDPPGCLDAALSLPTTGQRIRLEVSMRNGIATGAITANSAVYGRMRGVYHGVREPQVAVGLRFAGYLVDIQGQYLPLPVKAVKQFNKMSFVRLYTGGRTTGPHCDTRWAVDSMTPGPIDDIEFAFPETIDDDPALASILPSYEDIVGGATTPGPPSTVAPNNPSLGTATTPMPRSTGDGMGADDDSNNNEDDDVSGGGSSPSSGAASVGAVVGGLIGACVAIGAVVFAVMRYRASAGHGGGHGGGGLFGIAGSSRVGAAASRGGAGAAGEGTALANLLLQRSKRVFAVEYPKLVADAEAFEASFRGMAVARNTVRFGRELGQGRFGTTYEATLSNPMVSNPIHSARSSIAHLPTTTTTTTITDANHNGRGSKDVGAVAPGIEEQVTAQLLSKKDTDMQLEFLVHARVLLALSRHPSMLGLRGVVVDGDPFVCLTERVQQGTLAHFFQHHRATFSRDHSAADLVQCLHKVAAGLTFIESKCIVHRNLSLENIHVGHSLRDVRISGFALARNVYRTDVYLSTHQQQHQQQRRHSTLFGRDSNSASVPSELRYSAPEVLEDGEYTTKTDVYAFGVVMWEVLHLGDAFPVPPGSALQVAAAVRAGKLCLQPSAYMPAPLKAVVQLCLHVQPRFRPAFETLHTKLTYLLDARGTGADGAAYQQAALLSPPSGGDDADALDVFAQHTPAAHSRKGGSLTSLSRVDGQRLAVEATLRCGTHLVVFVRDRQTNRPACVIAANAGPTSAASPATATEDGQKGEHGATIGTGADALARDLRLILRLRAGTRFLPARALAEGVLLQGGEAVSGLVVPLHGCTPMQAALRDAPCTREGQRSVTQLLLDLCMAVEHLSVHRCDVRCLVPRLLFVREGRLAPVLVPQPLTPTEPTSTASTSRDGLQALLRLVRDMWSHVPAPLRSALGQELEPLISAASGSRGSDKGDGDSTAATVQSLAEAVVLLQRVNDERREVAWRDLDFVKELGSGQFGTVQLMTLRRSEESAGAAVVAHSRTGRGNRACELVAVKTLLDASCQREFLAEMRLMSQLHHPNLVEMLHSITEEQPLAIVLEYVQHGTLESLLTRPTTSLGVEDTVQILYDVACGAGYLANQGLVHRDIAARNVLVGRHMQCKLADFGLSRAMQIGSDNDAVYYRVERNRSLPLRWIAPEVLATKKFTTASDVFAFGMLLYEILTKGDLPYSTTEDKDLISHLAAFARHVQEAQPPPRPAVAARPPADYPVVLHAPPSTPLALAGLFYRTTCPWPSERPSFFDIIAMLAPHNVDTILQGILPSPTPDAHASPPQPVARRAPHQHATQRAPSVRVARRPSGAGIDGEDSDNDESHL